MRKKICLLMVAISGITMAVWAQNRKIDFDENQEWKSIVGKAKKAGKPIFMDCYTVWCGPCKMLDRDVFSNDQVADFYNEHFFNVKYDMEKAEGVELKDKFAVKAFPTLLFIDPNTEQVIHRVVGAGSVEHILAQAKVAVDPRSNLSGIKAAFEAGEKNADTVAEYMQALRRAGMSTEQNQVTSEYLEGLSTEEFMQTQNWDLFEKYVTDPLSVPTQTVFANRPEFSKAIGTERVNSKLSSTLMIAVNRFRNKESDPIANFDHDRYDTLMNFLTNIEDSAAPGCLVQLYAAGYAQQADYLGLINVLRTSVKYNMIQNGKRQIEPIFLMTYLTKLAGRTDSEVQKQTIEFIDQIISSSDNLSSKASFTRIKSLLLGSYGDEKGAAEAEEEAKKLREKGGGSIMIKMG